MSKKVDKIGSTEYITVKSHARELYLPLRAEIRQIFGIKKGDLLKVKLEGIVKKGGEELDE